MMCIALTFAFALDSSVRDGLSFRKLFSVAQPLTCSVEPGGDCEPVAEDVRALVGEARDRLREIKKRHVFTIDPLLVPPLIVYSPAASFQWNPQEPQTLDAYLTRFRSDAWLGPAVRVYETFFAQRPTAPQGFVLEAGGLDGIMSGSNSYLFERYLGWKGLMVEANQHNFATLLATRPGIFRAETALCPVAGNLSFTGGGCCSSVAGKTAPHTGAGLRDGKWADSHAEPRTSNEYKVRCTPIGSLLRAMRVPSVDFFSLDVESAEYAVLSGMDWTIPFSVLMIERCKGSSPQLLRSKGFVRAREAEHPGKCRGSNKVDCPRDQVWYHPGRIQPSRS
tara:strand:+ start:146 stop:1153 length:1008 start_codon:yes stop_codon:yes gene_type:complete